MEFETTGIDGVLLLTPKRFADSRGFFSESWNRRVMQAQGLDYTWVQENHSLSNQIGTVRGLHCQFPPHGQAKLVRCGRGALFDVVVDIRKGSPTYGQWEGFDLSFENGRQVLIPEGFLHGFVTRAAETEIIYKCSGYYAPAHEGTVRFDCPDLAIDWGLEGTEPLLSDKDAAAPGLADFESPFEYDG